MDSDPSVQVRISLASLEALEELRDNPSLVLSNGMVFLPTYNEDGLITTHICDFLQDPRFQNAYQAGQKTGSWLGIPVRYRAHLLLWAAQRGTSLEGDFVECGVYTGGFAMAVCTYLNFQSLPKKFFLMDTFSGLVNDQLSEQEKERNPAFLVPYHDCHQEVLERFKEFPNVVIIRGAIPDALPLCEAEKVAFLSIDMNCAKPEIAAAEHFWDRMVRGAAMILDDYANHDIYVEQRKAFHSFARRKGVEILTFPTGQGLILKP